MESKDIEERKVKVQNEERLKNLEEDNFHHLGINSNMKHFNETFSDIKFVCFGGSAQRMEKLAKRLQNELNSEITSGLDITNICSSTDRYVMFKSGQVLCVNHGIGISSTFVVLHEVIKVLYYSNASNVCFFRVGTSGGLGLDPGSVVITKQAFDSGLRPYLEVPILGNLVKKESHLDSNLNEEVANCAQTGDNFAVVIANTICAWDFYEGQGRLDGAFCCYSEDEKMKFLRKAHDEYGICNIEMESLCFGALCHQSNISASVVCVTYLDRFKGDQILASHETLTEWQDRPIKLVIRYIKRCLQGRK